MNLAFLAKRYDTVGGTERDLYELTRRLAGRGHAVHLYAQEWRCEPAAGVTAHRVPRGGPFRAGRLWALASRGPAAAFAGRHELVVSYARTLKQDIIRCGGGAHETYLDQAGEGLPWPARWNRRLSPYHRIKTAIERRQYRPGSFRAIQAISDVVKEEIVKAFGLPPADVKVVYDGVDLEHFRPDVRAGRAEVRDRFGIPPGASVILFVGNAFRRKGLDTLIRAAAMLRGRDVYVLAVGHDREAGEFRRLAARSGLGARAVFAGVQRDVRPFYGAADLLALPSRHESFGNVVLEAMACGLPVVVSARAGAAEILAGSLRAGRLANCGDERELALRLEQVLDLAAGGALATEARELAEHFGLEAHTRNVEQHYREVLDRR